MITFSFYYLHTACAERSDALFWAKLPNYTLQDKVLSYLSPTILADYDEFCQV